MGWMAPDIMAGCLVLMELLLPSLAVYAYFRDQGHTLAEAAAYGAIIPLMLLSGIYQLAAAAGRPAAAWIAEAALMLAATAIIWRKSAWLIGLGRGVLAFGRTHPIPVLSLAAAGLWLGVQAWLGSGLSGGPELPWTMLRDLAQGHPLAVSGPRPANAQWTAWVALRMNSVAGGGLTSLWAYFSIGFATYALGRRYAWPPTAITATLVVMSMPRLAALAPSGQAEILQAGAAVLSLLAVYRIVERPTARDLMVLAGAIPFTLGGSGIALALPAILGGLATVLILRRHDYRMILPALKSHPYHLLLALGVLVVFAQIPLLGYPGAWITVPANPDGLQGSLANLARYLLESLHLTRPVEALVLAVADVSPRLFLERIFEHGLGDPLGRIGATADFRIHWSPSLPRAWFGPLGCLMVLPAIAYALFKGPRRLKAVAVALAACLYLVTLIPAWQPGNAFLFTPFFSMGGFCTAYFLPPWRFTRRRRIILQVLCAGLLGYTCLSNSALMSHWAAGPF